MASMKKVKIAEAKNTLSALLRHVRRGGRVRIYDRNVPVADLIPVQPVDDEDDGALMESLVRDEIARPPSMRDPLPPDFFEHVPRVKGKSLVETLLEERQEREDAVLGCVGPRSPRRGRGRKRRVSPRQK